jgi:hypothetical protein
LQRIERLLRDDQLAVKHEARDRQLGDGRCDFGEVARERLRVARAQVDGRAILEG